jgi:hypothetical protein
MQKSIAAIAETRLERNQSRLRELLSLKPSARLRAAKSHLQIIRMCSNWIRRGFAFFRLSAAQASNKVNNHMPFSGTALTTINHLQSVPP